MQTLLLTNAQIFLVQALPKCDHRDYLPRSLSILTLVRSVHRLHSIEIIIACACHIMHCHLRIHWVSRFSAKTLSYPLSRKQLASYYRLHRFLISTSGVTSTIAHDQIWTDMPIIVFGLANLAILYTCESDWTNDIELGRLKSNWRRVIFFNDVITL